ncbi:hypothetical protein [Flagellimonas baculiformis]|uniref:hypothetical protein n=1 Tax=Flagellimonas baculiformis TaxID=3067310 RepID=UPI00296F9541|nr:hypothetical protein [Muricauda sp. D6]
MKPIQEDTLYHSTYPEGVYVTKADFVNKTPSENYKVYPVDLFGGERLPEVSKVHNCYFFDVKTSQKAKNVFAVSFNGSLYFQIKAILKNRNKDDKAQSANRPNSFVMAIMGGENYLYTEAELVNKWAAGTAVNFGAAGGAIYQDLIMGKGIVWDFKKEEFNIFISCKDYNEFIEDKLATGLQSCEQHDPDMFEVRKAISEIK